MFGGNLEPPKYVKRSRPKPMKYDIQLPGLTSGLYGHLGRAPNTDYHVRVLEHRQRVQDAHNQFLASEAKRLSKESITARYDKRSEKKDFQRAISVRFKEKLKNYEATIERRREKLRELLCQEEQDFISETIDQAQKGVDSKMEEMKQKAELLKAQREAERLEIVNKKRMMQLIEECKELRPVLVHRNLVDTKTTHLQQMKENEMKREAEKELDSMWYDLMMKELEAKNEKEQQDMLRQKLTMRDTIEIWEKQIQGKELLKQEAEKIAMEDHIEMVKLQEQLRREEIEALDSKRRKRDQIAKELREQIEIQEKFIKERKKEEEALDNAWNRLAINEVERERQKIQDTTSLAKREVAIYREHLKQLAEERKKEEQQLHDLLDEHKKIIEKKQEEAYCKFKKAREELHKNVLAERAKQLEYKKQEAENLLKMKEAENELLRMACETNERLQAEHDRLQAEEVRQYREDLKKQIESNNEKRRLEKEQLERELAEGLAEEERRRQNVLKIIDARLEAANFKHPFTKIIEKPFCPCSKSN